MSSLDEPRIQPLSVTKPGSLAPPSLCWLHSWVPCTCKLVARWFQFFCLPNFIQCICQQNFPFYSIKVQICPWVNHSVQKNANSDWPDLSHMLRVDSAFMKYMDWEWELEGGWSGFLEGNQGLGTRRKVNKGNSNHLASHLPWLLPLIFSKWSSFLPQETIQLTALSSSLHLAILAPTFTLFPVIAGLWHLRHHPCA